MPRSGDERVCQLVIRCTIEVGIPGTLRIRTTYFPELATGKGEVRHFATVDAATAAVAAALAAFTAQAAGPPRAPGSA